MTLWSNLTFDIKILNLFIFFRSLNDLVFKSESDIVTKKVSISEFIY